MKAPIASLLALALALSSDPAQGKPAAKPGKAQQGKPAPSGASGPPSKVCGAASLSEIRQKMFAELDEVIPSIQGVRKSSGRNLFDGVKPMSQATYADLVAHHKPIATTCGLLPGVMVRRLGLKGILGGGGTEGLRLCGQGLGKGVWHENDGSARPKPGDLYWLRYPKTPGTDSVAHVGIICSTEGDSWQTADAGQGSPTQQQAQIVNRHMKKVDGTHFFLSGPGYVGDSSELRRIGGWIDLDALMKPEIMEKAAKLKLVQKGWSATCK